MTDQRLIIIPVVVSPERIPGLVPDESRLTEMIMRAVEEGQNEQ